MKIIGISGRAGAGKDEIAKILRRHGYYRIAFADALKGAAQDIFSLSWDQLYGNEKEIVDPRWDKSPRQILQLLGTEAVRGVFGEDTWIKALRFKIEALREREGEAYNGVHTLRGFVIPDVRFVNEADAVRDWGGEVWRVERPGIVAVNAHASEVALDDYAAFTRTVRNDGTIYDLRDTIAKIVA